MRKCKSLKWKLLVSILALLFSFTTLVLSVWYTSLKNQAERAAIANMSTQIKVSTTAFESQARDIINVAALTTSPTSNSLSANILSIFRQQSLSDAEIIAYRRNARDYLISLCSFKKYLYGLMLSNYDRENVSYGMPTQYAMLEENGWLDELAGSDMVFIPPHYPAKQHVNENDLVFSVLRPVTDYDGSRIGFVVADVTCELFRDSFDPVAASGMSMYIVDEATQTCLYESGSSEFDMEQINAALPALLASADAESGSFLTELNGTKHLIEYNRSTLTGWTTLCTVPEAVVLSEYSAAAKKVLVATLVLFAAALVLIYTLSSLLTSNIVKLTREVEAVDGGHLELAADIRSGDEVETLAQQFSAMLARIRTLLAQVKQKEQEKRLAEISALQFQMNPHFLYNSLNTIKFLASIQGIENIQRVSELLSGLMHTNMDERSTLTVREDADFIRSYLELQTYRYTNVFSYEIETDPAAAECPVPKLMVQPLVENALKHGLQSKLVDGCVHIRYRAEGGALVICVEDNGCGMSPEQIEQAMQKADNTNAGHIGLHNIQERIRLYFGEAYGLSVESREGEYTRFVLRLPAQSHEEVTA